MAKRHLLLPLRCESVAMSGVDFISSFFSDKREVRLSLMNIVHCSPETWDRGYGRGGNLGSLDLSAERKGRECLHEIHARLEREGFLPEHISRKVLPTSEAKAQVIVREGSKGLYDAVVLGHRALVSLECLFEGSVCGELFESLAERIGFPFWVCRRLHHHRKNVLLCADGSEPSLRIADHVGFMLAAEPAHDVTILHIKDASKERRFTEDEVMERTVAAVTGAGLDEGRIRRVVKGSGPVAKSILQEVQEGGYAVVAVGSAGAGHGFFKKMFVGSVARTLFSDLTGSVLWVCY
ncbi:universal stress protein [Desulfovibrio mangrovi]|uniref:universal stress protein n=1 Tax=Desulfovibrio mangrovi TaxID=2976983 RepID=UPI0022474681|nr:universal stress protein [Desulfovibrio mangrovi]UZP68810.1 universal stress protein [Desulfovibrio mangrovi]